MVGCGKFQLVTPSKLASQRRRSRNKSGASASTSASRYEHEMSSLVAVASLMTLNFAVFINSASMQSRQGRSIDAKA